jgi:hypothetical protein
MITQRRECRVSRLEETNAGCTVDDDVTASEIAAFAYCAKAWHLERVVNALPSPAAARARAAGVTHHARHGADVRLGSWLGRRSRWTMAGLLLFAFLLAVLSLLMR